MRSSCIWMWALLLLVTARGWAAETYGASVIAAPAHVTEGQPYTLTIRYVAPEAGAKLHVEIKDPYSTDVHQSQIVSVKGRGETKVSFPKPPVIRPRSILAAVWLGETWMAPLGDITMSAPIPMWSASQADQDRKMQAAAPQLLKQLHYRASQRGTIAIYDEAAPGVNRQAGALLAAALKQRGMGVTLINAEALSNPWVLTKARFDLLVLPGAESAPADAMNAIDRYARSGGHLALLGGPAFANVYWKQGGKWLNQNQLETLMHETVQKLPQRHTLFSFDSGLPATNRSTNDASGRTTVGLDTGRKGRALVVRIDSLTGWETIGLPELTKPLPKNTELTCFWAKGGGNTQQLAVEWQEKDGSRWIGTVPLSDTWRFYAMPPAAFKLWDPQRTSGRGGPNDEFRPAEARKLTVGLAFTHTTLLRHGKHAFWIDEISMAPSPPQLQSLNDRIKQAGQPPIMEGVSPAYKLYDLTTVQSVKVLTGQNIMPSFTLPSAARWYAPHPRPQGTGIGKQRKRRFIPLVEARLPNGELAGYPASLIANTDGDYKGSQWLTIPVADTRFFRNASVIRATASTIERMVDGVMMAGGGARWFAATDGEAVDFGVELAALGRARGVVSARVEVFAKPDGRRVFAKDWQITAVPGRIETRTAPWTIPGDGGVDYTVRATLMRGSRVIDRLEHTLLVWRPDPQPSFMTVKDGIYWVDGKPWFMHGVNYMPSSGIGLEGDSGFEYWLDPAPYDPEVIDRDLRRVRAIGFNSVSVFIYERSADSHNLFDLLERCRRLGLRVNLSLRPGTPMAFQWNAMKRLIETHRLSENDTVFAYDLAWEPVFGWLDERRSWNPQWQDWLVRRYGSVEAAEAVWKCQLPRRDGIADSPPDAWLDTPDNEGRLAAIDYRRFADDLVHARYKRARDLVRSIDPNHLVSFRMNTLGDPTCGQSVLPYDPVALRGAVDFLGPEGYGRIGNWERVKGGLYTAAYCRAAAPEMPVMWAEFGNTAWDMGRMRTDPEANKTIAQFYTDYYEMILKSGANGSMCWWYPGGFRVGENSDFGVINPDGTWRPVTHVIRKYADPIINRSALPKATDTRVIDRYQHPDGIRGVFRETEEWFYRTFEAGGFPALQWTEDTNPGPGFPE